MVEIIPPGRLDARFAAVLRATKQDFVAAIDDAPHIRQHGAVLVDTTGFPGWPQDLAADEPVIETYVARGDDVTAMSDNQPFVTAWQPLVAWMAQQLRSALAAHDVALDGPAYVTASLTATDALEGVAHMDDDTFVPTDTVSLVAIIGQHAGPRIASRAIDHGPLRPMSQVKFSDDQLTKFAADGFDHCRCEADQLILFPQFGQLHAGPAAAQLAALAPSRQLLVYRARVHPA